MLLLKIITVITGILFAICLGQTNGFTRTKKFKSPGGAVTPAFNSVLGWNTNRSNKLLIHENDTLTFDELGRPTAIHKTAHAIGRMSLMEILDNPSFRQPNIDDMPVEVQIRLFPLKIQDLNEQSEVLETTVRMQLTWQDARLSWDPALFSNVSEIVVPVNLIWAPDIAILNSVNDVYDVVQDQRFRIKVENTGRIWWHPTGIIKTYCKLNLRYFPFDRQTCWFVVESPTLDTRFMNITLRTNRSPVDTRMYMKGETWKLLFTGARTRVNLLGVTTKFARVEFYMHIERARIYHIINVILPAVFLSVVQVMFFLVPVTHPQRLGSSTTTLLSVVVFQTVAISHLPNTSTDIPLLTIYIFFVVFVSALSVSTSVVVAQFAVYASQKRPLPKWLANIPRPSCSARWLICCCSDDIKAIITDSSVGKNRLPSFEVISIDHDATPPSPRNPTRHHNEISVTLSNSNVNIAKQEAYQKANSPIREPLFPQHSLTLQRNSNLGADLAVRPRVYTSPRNSRVFSSNNDFLNSVVTLAPEPSPPAKQSNDRLFESWNDVSRHFDHFLMIFAASIAFASPIILFMIVPLFAEDFYPDKAEMRH